MKEVKDEYLDIIEEVNNTLEKYNIDIEDKQFITNVIESAYYRLSEAYASGRTLEKILEKNNIDIDLSEYINIRMEEIEKYPFTNEEI